MRNEVIWIGGGPGSGIRVDGKRPQEAIVAEIE
jgi:hypothetical protein